jgi:NADH-quinone oxidoreductase subunit L
MVHLWIIPVLCFTGFVLNLLFGRLWSQKIAGVVGIAFVAAAFVYAVRVALLFSALPHPYLEIHHAWMTAGTLSVPYGFQLDQLSLVMMLVVTGVGLLIHIYSLGYMAHEGGFYRYFALLNMFMFFMLVLVLANNYLLMFIGWEGVGFASYMLIGFFFRRDSASKAGMKAFIVNRIGDFGFLIGLFLIFQRFGSFVFTDIFPQVRSMPVEAGWTGVLTAIGLLLFVGATGKSAQIPLYVWLPDAMEGPTPVSALIHAATMVTAGVYMVARSAAIYDRSPAALSVVLAIGALTAIFAASIGILQNDIKKVLAYSTISQLGYMFMACGAMAYGAGIFHLMTHAFFKALLFLGAGSVIHAMHGEQDMRAIQRQAPGGLRRYAPITFWTFVIATCAISGIPGFSGFFSKDAILFDVYSGARGNRGWWLVGTIAAFMTSFYMFRAVFMTFFGAGEPAHHGPQPSGQEPHTVVAHDVPGESGSPPGHAAPPHESPAVMTVPLLILGFLALTGGYVAIGDRFANFMEPVFNTGVTVPPVGGSEGFVTALSVTVAGLGILLAWYFYLRNRSAADRAAAAMPWLYRVVANKYFVDEAYDGVFIRPLRALSRAVLWHGVDVHVIDAAVNGVGASAQVFGDGLRRQQSGNIRSYASWVAAAAVIVLVYIILGGTH